MEVKQNVLYLTTSGNYINRDHLTLRVEADRDLKLAVPIHYIESICSFGQNSFSPQAMQLCWDSGVSVNCFSESGYFLGRWEGVANTSVVLRRTQYRKADDPLACLSIARDIVAGKIYNCRQSVLRSARESDDVSDIAILSSAAERLSSILYQLERERVTVDEVRGFEGSAANVYFAAFSQHLRQQRSDFHFQKRSRRPPLDMVNCLLSFLYALVRHDCIAALTATGLDPFVGYLHAERPNRPSLALDLMEEFRPFLADRLAITLINRRQISPKDFIKHDGGAVELAAEGRKKIIAAYQTRKQDTVTHRMLGHDIRLAQLPLTQARILARHLRGDLPQYYPFTVR